MCEVYSKVMPCIYHACKIYNDAQTYKSIETYITLLSQAMIFPMKTQNIETVKIIQTGQITML